MLLAGGLAGASTRNGAKQGFAVGVFSSAVLIGVALSRQPNWLPIAGLTLISALTLCLVGGWFGSQLFPPVIRRNRKRQFDPAT